MFKITTKFKPAGDQPQAIDKLAKNIKAGKKHQVLLGVTGSGKTFTLANVIAKTGRPALIIEPNKTLAAQIYQELKGLFPDNGVHYFVSYYDYYQPEAYIPQTDTYIEKDSRINEVIDRMRHAAVQDILSRRDVIAVASVSCIYNIGSPQEYRQVSFVIQKGQKISRKNLLSILSALQYERNDIDFKPGIFRVRGNDIEIYSVTGETVIRVELQGNAIAGIKEIVPQPNGFQEKDIASCKIFPAKFWITAQEKIKIAMASIVVELQQRLTELKGAGKTSEAERLERRTKYDLEMIMETGYCHGIENYSRHMEFRKPGAAPFALLDYFPDDFLIFIDESHITLPQLKAMAVQDRQRKQALIEYGFRLPSAVDNRPLTFAEFEEKASQTVYVSATPSIYEMKKSGKVGITELLIRPTGLLEPSIEVRPTKNQLKDLADEIRKRSVKNQRVLAVTLTKRLAEELSEYFGREGIRAQWLHSEVKTLERPGILKDLREGKYEALIGINLLREGLDLPEVSLIAILDADKEGFLRNDTTLIQTMGRAARNPEGHVILYADKVTGSMTSAIREVKRRRLIQEGYNKIHNIQPQPITKEIQAWPFAAQKAVESEFAAIQDIHILEKEMRQAANDMDFERAAEIRDLIKKIKNGK